MLNSDLKQAKFKIYTNLTIHIYLYSLYSLPNSVFHRYLNKYYFWPLFIVAILDFKLGKIYKISKSYIAFILFSNTAYLQNPQNRTTVHNANHLVIQHKSADINKLLQKRTRIPKKYVDEQAEKQCLLVEFKLTWTVRRKRQPLAAVPSSSGICLHLILFSELNDNWLRVCMPCSWKSVIEHVNKF
jgi:hypothetical protein